jgi:inorganic pyrophosphatase
MPEHDEFWDFIDRLVAESEIVIDQPKGSAHAEYQETVYPLDYGYLAGTSSTDGAGIDVWLGASGERRANAVVCTVDLLKRDSEIKLLLGCADEEIQTIADFLNTGEMRCLLVRRPS